MKATIDSFNIIVSTIGGILGGFLCLSNLCHIRLRDWSTVCRGREKIIKCRWI